MSRSRVRHRKTVHFPSISYEVRFLHRLAVQRTTRLQNTGTNQLAACGYVQKRITAKYN